MKTLQLSQNNLGVRRKRKKKKTRVFLFCYYPQRLITGRETPSVLGCREFLKQMMQSSKLRDLNQAKPALDLHVYLSWQSDFVQCLWAGVHCNSYFKIPSIIYILCHKNPRLSTQQKSHSCWRTTRGCYSLETSAKASKHKMWLVK